MRVAEDGRNGLAVVVGVYVWRRGTGERWLDRRVFIDCEFFLKG